MPATNAPSFEAGASAGLFHAVAPAAAEAQRLDRVLVDAAEAAGLPLSRTRLQALIADGLVTVDDAVVRHGKVRISAGSQITVTVPPPRPAEPEPQTIPLDIIHEDEHLLVLEKPAGLVVHPAAGHDDGTLVNALIAHCGASLSGIGGVRRPGIVHRLDKNTSGLMVVAKSDAAHGGLSDIFADHGRSGSLVREYLAMVWGVTAQAAGTVDAALGRDPHQRVKVSIVPAAKGRRAVTHWTREQGLGPVASLLRCRLETGRTHQIRVHMASLGHPLIGDDVYGPGFRTKAMQLEGEAQSLAVGLKRQALHAEVLGFRHPVTGEVLRFKSPLPPDLSALRQALLDKPRAA